MTDHENAKMPAGTLTFVFTDIEDAAKLWQDYPELMPLALARHDRIVVETFEQHSGVVFRSAEDGHRAAFATALHAAKAVVDAQTRLRMEVWPAGLEINIRTALHTGTAEMRGTDYFGPTINRVSRILSVGHENQVLVSGGCYDLLMDDAIGQISFQFFGEHRLRDLGRPERIYLLRHPKLPENLTPLSSLNNYQTNLPENLTTFIGREATISDLKDILKSGMITITGTGGAGKSRLAQQVAAEVIDNFNDGVWLVELKPLLEPEQVPHAVAAVLGINKDRPEGLAQTIAANLKSKSMLIVLDNCEHLLEACSALVSTLLRKCPSLRIIATSREYLGVPGEHLFRIPNLTLPEAGDEVDLSERLETECVRLFLDRARLVVQSFEITDANVSEVTDICRALVGMPLAIELVAAQLRSMSLSEIARRLADSFSRVTPGGKTLLPKMQPLQTTIKWSYDMLSTSEKSVLQTLSVFAGSCSIDAAEYICAKADPDVADVLDSLIALVDKSLLIFEMSYSHSRYSMLETIRMYALEKLSDSGREMTVRSAHASYYADVAEEIRGLIGTVDDRVWIQQMESTTGNLRAAMKWLGRTQATSEDITSLLRIAILNHRLQIMNFRPREASNEIRQALARYSGGEPKIRADALSDCGTACIEARQLDAADIVLNEALAIYKEIGDIKGQADVYRELARSLGHSGKSKEGIELLKKSLELGVESGNRETIAWTQLSLGTLTAESGEALSNFRLAIDNFTKVNNTFGLGLSLRNRGLIYKSLADYPKASADFFGALRRFELAGSMETGLGLIHFDIAHVYFRMQDYKEARRHNDLASIHLKRLGMRELYGLSLALGSSLSLIDGNRASALQQMRKAFDAIAEMGEVVTSAVILHVCASLALPTNPSIAATLIGAAYAINIRLLPTLRSFEAEATLTCPEMLTALSMREKYPKDFADGEKITKVEAYLLADGWLSGEGY